jgi:hypothetical protein
VTPSYYTPIQGTHGFDESPDGPLWWQSGSAWQRFMATHNLEPLRPHDPFVWCTGLDGVVGADSHWIAGGLALRWYWRDVPYERRVAIVHSHGLRLIEVAAGWWHEPIKIRKVISLCSPIRIGGEAGKLAERAAANIGAHLHVYSKRDFDKWQTFGGIGDGAISFNRENPHATVNVGIEGIDHSHLLADPPHFEKWATYGLLAFLTAGDGVPA